MGSARYIIRVVCFGGNMNVWLFSVGKSATFLFMFAQLDLVRVVDGAETQTSKVYDRKR